MPPRDQTSTVLRHRYCRADADAESCPSLDRGAAGEKRRPRLRTRGARRPQRGVGTMARAAPSCPRGARRRRRGVAVDGPLLGIRTRPRRLRDEAAPRVARRFIDAKKASTSVDVHGFAEAERVFGSRCPPPVSPMLNGVRDAVTSCERSAARIAARNLPWRAESLQGLAAPRPRPVRAVALGTPLRPLCPSRRRAPLLGSRR